ncbi:MAG: PIG-L family deacetylase [Nitrosopumilus sp.]|nr:PIG-L family deacetylase [Nitrosopumilus sp.]MDH3384731.1 PIG-L family deacetylase [Nitrosopumilus sp.]
MNILAIGAHPDDIEIGCFATLAKHKMDGDNIFGVCVTQGEIGGDVEVRKKEAIEAAKVIGMELIFGDFPDGDVKENADLVSFLDKVVKDKKIDVLYTHSENDRHQDHRAVARAGLSVSRNVQEVYCFEACSLISAFTPQVFIDVTETFGYKISALRKYRSQVERTYVDGLEGIGRFRASQARLSGRLCEAFEAYKILRNENSPKYLETSDLKNQVVELKKIISRINDLEINKINENVSSIKTNDFLQEITLPNNNIKNITPSVEQKMNKENIDFSEIMEIKNEILKYKEEMEKLKKEMKMHRDSLLLKKEISLYKEALENASKKRSIEEKIKDDLTSNQRW